MADSVSAIVQVPDPYAARLLTPRSTLVGGTQAPAHPAQTSPAAATIQLQETVQRRRLSSELFSTLMTQDGRFLRPPQGPAGGAAAVTPRAGTPPARASWQAGSSWQGGVSRQEPAMNRPAAPQMAAPSGDSLESIRAAEDIIQAAFSAPPTAEGWRIAAEAFVMEAQAQRDFQLQQAQGMSRREWTA